jgi:hypothetical protein
MVELATRITKAFANETPGTLKRVSAPERGRVSDSHGETLQLRDWHEPTACSVARVNTYSLDTEEDEQRNKWSLPRLAYR